MICDHRISGYSPKKNVIIESFLRLLTESFGRLPKPLGCPAIEALEEERRGLKEENTGAKGTTHCRHCFLFSLFVIIFFVLSVLFYGCWHVFLMFVSVFLFFVVVVLSVWGLKSSRCAVWPFCHVGLHHELGQVLLMYGFGACTKNVGVTRVPFTLVADIYI